jgi:hypothetical protein
MPCHPAARTPVKIAERKALFVEDRPPAFGGRYFLFLKLKTACGIAGVGEVYATSFAPKAIVAMIEMCSSAGSRAPRIHGRAQICILCQDRRRYCRRTHAFSRIEGG